MPEIAEVPGAAPHVAVAADADERRRTARARALSLLGVVAVVWLLCSPPALAAVRVVDKGERWLDLALRVQIQYRHRDLDESSPRDRLLFRRLRPTIMGTLTPSWIGRFQIETGAERRLINDELVIKDAYARYLGFQDRGLLVTFGNQPSPFSREFNSSSERQQLVERTFVGDPNWGANNRMLGVKLEGTGRRASYKLALGFAAVVPLADRLLFDTPVNHRKDHNDGRLGAARLALHPRGEVALAQGDFERRFRWQLSLGAYSWSNDGTNNSFTDDDGRSTRSDRADVDQASGAEVDLALRGGGVSVDAEYQLIEADAVDSTFTGGVYAHGAAQLEKYAIEGGYVVPNQRLELTGAHESLDADSHETAWRRTSLGVNLFIDGHRIKAQLTYRRGRNRHGLPGAREQDLFLQFQYVF